MKVIQSNYNVLPPPARRAVWVTLLLGIALSIFAGQLMPETLNPFTSAQVRIANSIPIVLGLASFISLGLFISGRSELAMWFLFLPTIVGLVLATVLAEGYVFAASAIVVIVTISLPIQILKGRQANIALFIGVVTAIGILIIDTFLSHLFSRIEALPSDVLTANILASILIVIILVFLIAGFKNFSLRTKLIIAFLSFTLVSVGLVSAQSITMNSRTLTSNIGEQVNQIAESNASALGNEINRLVNVLSSISFSISLQSKIAEANLSYPEDQLEISDYILGLENEWQKAFATNRNSPLIYDRLTNDAAIELRSLSYRISNLGNLFVLDRHGTLVGSLAPSSKYNFSSQPWWENVYNNGKGGIYIGRPAYDDTIQKIAILVAVPVFDRAGNYFIGSVATQVPFDGFVERFYVNGKELGENAGISLVFEDNPPRILQDMEVRSCQVNGRKLINFHVGNDALVIVTSNENHFLKDVTKEQLRLIFTSAKTWSDINPAWPEEPVLRYFPETDLDITAFLTNQSLDHRLTSKIETLNTDNVLMENSVIEMVSNNPYAVSYLDLATYHQNLNKLKAISVEGKFPDQKTVEAKNYPLAMPIFISTTEDVINTIPQASAFVNFIIQQVSEEMNGFSSPGEDILLQSRLAWLSAMGLTELPQVKPGEYSGNLSIAGNPLATRIVKPMINRFIGEGFTGNIILEESETSQGIEQLCATDGVDFVIMNRQIQEDARISMDEGLSVTLQLSAQNPYFEQIINQKDSLVSVAPVLDQQASEFIKNLGWRIMAYNPLDDALGPVRTQERASIAILLVIGTVATAGALRFAQLLAGPIQRLSEVARAFGTGDMSTHALVETKDEIGDLAITFNEMADRIRHMLEGLEQQVNERTRAIVTSAEISRRLSRILDQRQLVMAVVEEIQRSFDFYHAQIYLYDDERKKLVMVGGTGVAGQTMMERGHHIELGRGLVGRCAAANITIVVSDTLSDPNWLPNRLLPETKSEAAIPIATGDRVIGVLDVQQSFPEGINQQTTDLLKSIANQVAIAVQNARLYQDAQNQAAKEAMILEIDQEIQKASSIANVAETIVRELGAKLGAKTICIKVDISQLGETDKSLLGFVFENNKVFPLGSDTQIKMSGNTISEKITVHGESIGELVVSGSDFIDDYTQDLVSRVASLLNLRIENIRLSDHIQSALHETDALYKIISELNSAKDYATILRILSKRTILSQVDQSLLMFAFDKPFSPNSNPEWVFPIAAQTHAQARLATRYPVNAFENTPNTLFTKSTVVIEDVTSDSRLDRITNILFQDVFKAQSSLIIPLLVGDQSLGFIMGNFGLPRKFSESDIQRLSTVANQVAVTVQGMQLLENTAKRARREQLLRELTAQVNSAVGTDAILKRAAEHIGKSLNRPVIVYLGNQTNDSGNEDTSVGISQPEN
jgi:GAF domain-containing protein/HAMP domain-containing protein